MRNDLYFKCKKLFPKGVKHDDVVCNCCEECQLEIDTARNIEEIEDELQELMVLIQLTGEKNV
ncbi:MAG: hypothetical protein EKK64_06810 [Neisseriaceae bacterium]|nr:MAG: hypothetical protein EKK64_06810 [Neisseriaceae bacterium]